MKEEGKSTLSALAQARKPKRAVAWQLRKEYKIVYDDGWREIMKEVSRELKVPYEDVERINTAWWKYVSEMMARVELPVIRMVYLFTMYPSVKELYRYCEKMGDVIEKLATGRKVLKLNKKVGDVGNMRVHLERLHDTYFRIQGEKGGKSKKGLRPLTDARKADHARMKALYRHRQITTTMVEARELKKQINQSNDRAE